MISIDIKNILTRFLRLLIVILLVSCGSNTERTNRINNVEFGLKNNDVEKSIEAVRDIKKYSNKDKLLYFMDNGILNFYGNNNKNSFHFLEKADIYQEELYTESIAQNTSTFLINDNQVPYSGEEYEILYLNVIKSLLFLKEGDLEKGMVEVRKGMNKLKLFETRYLEGLERLKQKIPSEFKGVTASKYSEDESSEKYNFVDSALLRLISLISHRDSNEPDEAMIDKKNIENLWKMYPHLYDFKKVDLDSVKLEKPKEGCLLDVIACSGMVLSKDEWKLNVVPANNFLIVSSKNKDVNYKGVFPFSGSIGSFNISVPYLKPRDNRVKNIVLYIDNKKYGSIDIFENISKIALNQYEYKKNAIILKSLIRSTLKLLVTTKAKQEARASGNQLIGTGVYLFAEALSMMSESADIRSWATLPENFYFKELHLEEGEYVIILQYLGHGGVVIKEDVQKVNLSRKNKTNIILSYGV